MPMRKAKLRHCDECRFWHYDEAYKQVECEKAHAIRFYKPRGPLDTNYGWKRKCAEFVPSNAQVQEPGVALSARSPGTES